MMTDAPNGHKATPEQWENQEIWANPDNDGDSDSSCILELRDTLAALEQRVQALEGKQWTVKIRPQTPAEIDERMRQAFREAIADGVVHPVPHDAPAPAAAPMAGEPVARLMHWNGKGGPRPCGTSPVARTYEEMPKGEAPYYDEGEPLYLHPAAAPAHLVPTMQQEALVALERIQSGDVSHGADDFDFIRCALVSRSAPAAAPADDDAWHEFLQELHSLQERALREGIGPRCDMVEWARLLWNGALAAEPATDELPPRVGHILRLAEIIREVDGNHDKGAAALAEAILSHPGIAEVLPHAPAATPSPHPDDAAVDRFADAMKAKLARARERGRYGWQESSAEYLSNALRDHLAKGDPVDVANFAMMLHQNGQSIQPLATASAPAPAGSLVEVVAALIANGIACDQEESRIAADVIAAGAEWLERRHTGRIANGSQFADLLREALEREAGR